MDAALAAVRAETPAPQLVPDTTATRSPGWRTQIQHRWYGLSRGIRIAMALAFLAVLVGGATVAVKSALAQRIDRSQRFQAQGNINRWTQRNTLATFAEETPSIVLGTITLNDFSIRDLRWIDGADGAVVLLRGKAHSPREGETALLTINPYLQQVNVSLPPVPDIERDMPAITLLGAGQRGIDVPGMLIRSNDGTYFLSSRPGAVPQNLAPWAARSAVLADTSGTVALTSSTPDGANQLLMVSPGDYTIAPAFLPVPGPIRSLAAHPDTGRVAVLYRTDAARGLEIFSTKYPDEPGELIREGNLGLGLHPFSPAGGKLVFLDDVEKGLGSVIVQSLYTAHDQTVIGTAYDVQWRPESEDLLLLAPDHAGRHQLWIASSTESDQRHQITHLDSGVGTKLVVSDDGRYAIVNIPDGNTFAIVKLPGTG